MKKQKYLHSGCVLDPSKLGFTLITIHSPIAGFTHSKIIPKLSLPMLMKNLQNGHPDYTSAHHFQWTMESPSHVNCILKLQSICHYDRKKRYFARNRDDVFLLQVQIQ